MYNLYHKVFGENNKKTLVIIHGFLGSSDNWLTLTKRWSQKFKIVLYDQRNHGRSFHSNTWDYNSMADDLKDLLDKLNIKKTHIIGHSMGGKTAQFFVHKYPEYCSKLVVADMGCKKYEPEHDSILEAMMSLNISSLESRKVADDMLKPKISNQGVRLFILKNLTRSDDGKSFVWKANLDIFYNNRDKVGTPVPQNLYFTKPTLFVYGGKSNYILEIDKEKIKKHYQNIKFISMPNVGHWLHVESPEQLTQIIFKFFNA